MPIKIKGIKIHAFRGIPELELELNDKSLLLRGENGTGKSSIIDALEFFFTGKISHLEGVKGLSLQRHGPHVNFSPTDVNIEMSFNPGNISLNRTFASPPTIPDEFKDYFQITQKGTFILRRLQLLAFIMSKPADRFRAIGSIIGIEPLDEIELGMMRVRDDLKGEVESKKLDIDLLIIDISTIMGRNISNTEDVLPALNEKLKEAKLPLIKSFEDVDKHAQEMLKAVKKAENIDRIRVLDEILETIKIDLIDYKVVEELNSFNDKVKYLLQEHIRLELSVADILENGRKVLKEEEKIDICPLCEQKIDRLSLLARIDNRLRTLRDLSDKASEIRTLSVPIINKLEGMKDKLIIINSKIEPFPELAEEKSKIIEKIAFLDEFVSQVMSAKDLKNEISSQIFGQQKNDINGIWSSISTKCGQLFNDIGLTKEEQKVLSVVRLIEQAKSKSIDISRVQSEHRIYKKQYEFAEKIFFTFSEVKKAKIQEVYDSIQTDIQNFYSSLHPKDPHKNIELTVALGKRASTELTIESFGRGGEDPRALTSEGHLDSLGLCIFLAFVKKFNECCTLVILDDIVSTVDAHHRENICKLLFEEFKDKQLLITTHDGVWYEQLRASQRAYKIEGDFKNLVIVDWSVDTGPKILQYKPRWEKILEKITSGDKNSAGNEGRQYLEWLLKKICVVTNATVPVNNWDSGTVGDLFAHARRRVDELVKDESYKGKISNAFTELEKTIILGNLLSHDNKLADEVSIDEVKNFCFRVHELYEVFLCPNCDDFIGYFRDLKILRCPNQNCSDPIEFKTK
ncbi:MAG: AAA family ATPase [Candidatus Methanoperedenaceae archaeon]|nr:AAA family ATPase [Candidatus Methanoperedenaceae archaeon]